MLGVIMKTIGLIPGGMKPFHAGHNFLVQNAIRECDEVYIFTSPKDRGALKGDNMRRAWLDLIQPLLPGLEEVRFVKSPVGAVFDFLEVEGMPEDEYRIYGGTEELGRFSESVINRYFPDLNVVQPAALNPAAYDRSKDTGIPV